MSVGFADQDSNASCKTCQALAVDGTLQGLQFAASAEKDQGHDTAKPQLTDKQVKFAAHPEVMTNATKAALDVGYSESYAKSQAVQLRKQLSPMIMENQERAQQLSAISSARIQTELASLGFANVIDYFHIAEDGSIRPKQLNELTRAQASAIQEVKVIELEDPETGEKRTVVGYLKLADKRANLVELGRSLGMFTKITLPDQKASDDLLREADTDALELAERILLKSVKEVREQKGKNNATEGEFTKLPSPSEGKE
jgi:phage terminase small subunit